MAKLELSGVLSALREEIAKAQLEANTNNEDVRFKVKDIEVELQTAIDWEFGGKGGGKIKFWVFDVNAEGSGKYKNSKTHKIKLSLQPLDANNPDDQGQAGELLLNDAE